jgi:hypothetical protein
MHTDPRNRSTAELKLTYDNMLETMASLKANIQLHEQILTERFGAQLQAELKAEGKTSGEISRTLDGVKLILAIKPKVKWDNDKLQAVASTLPQDTVFKVFKIEFSVPERTFKALTDDKLIAALTDARTVDYPAPKVTFA